MHSWPDLRPILQGVPWVIAGGVATRAYMPERMTHDLDILIRPQDAAEVRARLAAAGYEYSAPLAVPGFTVRSACGLEIDVLLGDAPWLEAALAAPAHDAAGYPVLALPYLILLKLQASRTQDLADISRMLGLADDAAAAQVQAIVNRYMPDALEDLLALRELGRLENA